MERRSRGEAEKRRMAKSVKAFRRQMASQGEREEEESGGQTKNFIPLTLGLWFIEKSAERKVAV